MKKDKTNNGSGVTRRSFAKRALLATAVAVVPSEVIAKSKPEATGQANQQQPVPPIVEARLATLLSRYGDRLSDEQKADCKRLLIQAQKSSDAMRAFALDNSNEPATIFRVYRAKKN